MTAEKARRVPNAEDPIPSGIGDDGTTQPWFVTHSVAVTVGCAALLGAITIGCHVLLGAALDEDDRRELMR